MTSSSDSRLRLRAILSAQFTVVVVVCLLCAAAGAGAVYTTHVEPGTDTEERVTASWSVESAYDHSAEVTEPNSVFPVGDRLDDRSIYFARIAPVLDVDVETRYDATAASDVTVTQEAVLVVRNVDGATVYWAEREPLASVEETDVQPGDTVNASFSLNTSAIDRRVDEIESELGASPGETEVFVTTDVSVSGSVDGESVAHARSLDLGVSPGGDTYSVDDPGPQADTIDRTETVEVERTYGPLRTVGGPLLLVVGLAGAGALAYARREDALALTEAERTYLDYLDDRSEFGEWITRIRLPESAFDRPEARAESLGDLVDFAIDNDVGVVEDPTTEAFHVVTDDYVYTYVPPAVPDALATDDPLAPDSSAGAGGEPGEGDPEPPADVDNEVDGNGAGLFTDPEVADDVPERSGDGDDDATGGNADDATGESAGPDTDAGESADRS